MVHARFMQGLSDYEELDLAHRGGIAVVINVLERKGIITKKEVLDELEVIASTKGKKEIN